MTLAEIIGYVAAILLVACFLAKTTTWIRYGAVAFAVVLGVYAIVSGHYVVLVLAVLVIAANAWRIWEAERLVGDARAAAAGAGAPVTVDWLLPHMETLAVPEGHILFHKGDVADAMYFISHGRVGLEELGIEIGKDSLFGEMGVFAIEKVRTATAVCLEDCSLLRVSAERIRELFYENPDFAFFLVGVITRRLTADLERAVAARPAA
ncbi:MAG: cyclic nucleotide-binding domain-containing protein [Rhizobiales bacterium]|nr:cyclic nucleotide-binding domain-containing protein [Hyphomicrobiales bacterium]